MKLWPRIRGNLIYQEMLGDKAISRKAKGVVRRGAGMHAERGERRRRRRGWAGNVQAFLMGHRSPVLPDDLSKAREVTKEWLPLSAVGPIVTTSL